MKLFTIHWITLKAEGLKFGWLAGRQGFCIASTYIILPASRDIVVINSVAATLLYERQVLFFPRFLHKLSILN